MSAWPGKYVIGLTGNIATGKSVVRKMLEHLGAYGIDADALSHRTIARGAPGYQPVLDTFGKWILAPDGQIDRTRLGLIVFSDPQALALLEAIIHPLVGQAVDILVRRARQNVIAIEAIKLIESGLRSKCDSLWVAASPEQAQLNRLVQKRGMDRNSAIQRIKSQHSQEEKIALANVVIQNSGSFEETWRQVVNNWKKLFPTIDTEATQPSVRAGATNMAVQRAGPRQAGEIAMLITQLSRGQRTYSQDDIMASFGEKAFLILRMDNKPVGVIGWKVENLIARTDSVYLEPGIPISSAMQALMKEVERTSRELQCEVSLLFLPADFAFTDALARNLGYQRRSVQSLSVRAWQEAAIESMPSGSVMLFKQLRQDRVLRPV
jgi:dephospho-CoA kinase